MLFQLSHPVAFQDSLMEVQFPKQFTQICIATERCLGKANMLLELAEKEPKRCPAAILSARIRLEAQRAHLRRLRGSVSHVLRGLSDCQGELVLHGPYFDDRLDLAGESLHSAISKQGQSYLAASNSLLLGLDTILRRLDRIDMCIEGGDKLSRVDHWFFVDLYAHVGHLRTMFGVNR